MDFFTNLSKTTKIVLIAVVVILGLVWLSQYGSSYIAIVDDQRR
jgi:hypothetical protein